MIKFLCGCASTNSGMKIEWCDKHNAGLPDVHQTEEYYH